MQAQNVSSINAKKNLRDHRNKERKKYHGKKGKIISSLTSINVKNNNGTHNGRQGSPQQSAFYQILVSDHRASFFLSQEPVLL
jgi:hypothetical protein